MGWTAAAFREQMNLGDAETIKIFLFIFKAVAAIGYIFVLGFIAAGGPVGNGVITVLLLAAVLDLVPELLSVKLAGYMPPTARTVEYFQLLLTATAYLILGATLFTTVPISTFAGYSLFAVIWITAFLLQEGVIVLLEPEHDD